VFNAVSIALGKSGTLTPFVAAFLSHMVALITAICLIKALP
jgi:lipopolysaccharide export LptBFGC system permease protein LptF